ncbi:hypothetical protein QUF84_00170 [Fictibacillus enclensis]|uniref:hypothetical protein n=1 Tax=Fictibacillus enclensis TaxID=1017270 RepID=UPI0025A236E6|nr:hypothetical protein [Fictibacillus enclensis]MDM5335711.1 hypothetical protein [Fictibacillus enclensis]
MTTLQFIASLVKSLVWPLAIVWIAYKFKTPITNLLDRIKRITVPGVGAEIDVSEKIEDINEKLDKEIEEKKETYGASFNSLETPIGIEPQDSYRRVAQGNPNAAIPMAWVEVEQAILSVSKELGLPMEGKDPIYTLKQLAKEYSSIKSTVAQARHLKALCDEANLGNLKISFYMAMEYYEACSKIVRILMTLEMVEKFGKLKNR